MGKMRGCRRWVRLLMVCGLLGSFLAIGGGAPVAVGAAGPASVPLASPPANAGIPDHRAEQEYFASLRQAPSGTTAGEARFAAGQQAQALPKAQTLPAALGGKGAPVSKNGLAPPSAIWQQLGPQPEDTNTLPNSDSHFGLVSGRTTAIAVAQHTPGLIYIGTADGGVWKSTNDGASWMPLTDRQQSLSIGSLALDPADPTDNTLYAGTGEANYVFPNGFNGDSYFGIGVLKTTDGGATWVLVGPGLPNFTPYGATSVGIGVMVANGPGVWAGTTHGLYQSTNSGTNWTQVAVNASFPNARVTDITVDGANVYVVLSEARTGYSYAGIYKSTTGGTAGSFNPIMTGLPTATAWDRSQVAMARSAPLTLYLAIAGTVGGFSDNLLDIYKTIDGGATWNLTTTQPPNYMSGSLDYTGTGQGFYDNMIAVNPANANLVYAGGVHVVGSTDGGGTWAVIVNVYCNFTAPCNAPIHPDNHAAAFGPSGTPHPLYIANDGGAWKTANGDQGAAATWSDLNTNLATTQFYGADVAANYTATPIVIAGSQDNGTSRTASTAIGTWNGIRGGDGGFVSIDKTDPNTVVASYPHSMWRTTNANAGSAITWDSIQPSGNCQTGLFVSPFMIDPNVSAHIILGSGGYLCESIASGAYNTWAESNLRPFDQAVQSVMIAPANSAVIYAGTDGGRIYRTTNGNVGTTGTATWNDLWTGKVLPSTPVTWIAVDRNDPTGNIAYATFGGFGVGHTWKTINGGTSWTNITGNLPNAPVTGLVTYPISGGSALIAGTDVGAFLSTNSGASWTALQNGLPNVGIDQVFTDKALTTLFVATHGRGVWKMPIPADTFPALTAAAISPTSGATLGGTNVTITGTNFRAGASVSFDGVAATNVVVVNTTTITATTPVHAAGQVNVTVLNTDNQGAILAFTYIVVVPAPQPPSRPGPNLHQTTNPDPSSRGGPNLGQPTNPIPSPRH